MFDISDLMEYSQHLTLLYVEDDSESRESAYLLLEQLFNKVIIAVDGADGLEKFKINNIDIIITDLNMPNMNGIAMMEKIKQINNNIPTIILSAHNEKSYMKESVNLGIIEYIHKPLDMDQLFEALYNSVKKISINKV